LISAVASSGEATGKGGVDEVELKGVCGCWDCEALISAVASSGEATGKGGVDEVELKGVCDEVAYFKIVEVSRRGGLAVPGWEILNGKK